MFKVLTGDALTTLRTMPDESVHCIVTSPPYWGLRDYGVEGQLGLEPTPELYLEHMVAVFREARRVLRSDGTAWVNMGDSYNAGTSSERINHFTPDPNDSRARQFAERSSGRARKDVPGLKPKDLCGIPWRLALALQADGWTLRSDIVWSKPNPMPESVRDRPTKSHEYIFMFSKARWVGPERGMFADISDGDARWLAMFLDTEGNIAVKRVEREGRKWYGAQIAFASTSRELVETARQIVGKGTVLERPGKNAPMYYYQLSNRVASGLLHRAYPFLIVKRRQARIAIHLQSLLRYRGGRGPDRMRTDAEVAVLESLWRRNKECNHFGNPDLRDVPEPRFGKWVSARYFYDAEAIKEDCSPATHARIAQNLAEQVSSYRANGGNKTNGPMRAVIAGSTRKIAEAGLGIANNRSYEAALALKVERRNARSVWTIPTQSFSEAHFATFPEALAERCIRAGTSERGCCPECGAPWVRVVERTPMVIDRSERTHELGRTRSSGTMLEPPTAKTTGFRPTCSHALDPVPCTVLDPFGGAGTVGLVASKLKRDYILIELNPKYTEMAERRIETHKNDPLKGSKRVYNV